MERAELDFGPFGTVYYDGDGRVLGSMQYGPAPLFPRARRAAGRARRPTTRCSSRAPT